jgi:signal transduction histidine kinase
VSHIPPHEVLQDLAGELLRPQAADLAARWTVRAREVLLLDRPDDMDLQTVVDTNELVDALIGSTAVSEEVPESAIRHGLRFGANAFTHGVLLHQVMKALDLLAEMTLYALESELGRSPSPAGTAAEGVRFSRRLQHRRALLSLAATRGYMQAYADALRDQFRQLRHDLRNPLGTIKSVLALMDDDSVPLEARVNPNFRAMATRNAKSLDELIADQLSDAAALLPGNDVSVRAVACAVCRELQEDAERRGVSIFVEQGGPQGQLDAAGLELLLRGALQAALRECDSGDRLQVEFKQSSGRASVAVSHDARRPPVRDAHALECLGVLARQIGASFTAEEDHVLVSIQFRPGNQDQKRAVEREQPVPQPTGGLSDGEPRQDVRGAREGHHGQASAH